MDVVGFVYMNTHNLVNKQPIFTKELGKAREMAVVWPKLFWRDYDLLKMTVVNTLSSLLRLLSENLNHSLSRVFHHEVYPH